MTTRAELKQRAKNGLNGKWGIAIGVLLVSYIIISILTSPSLVSSFKMIKDIQSGIYNVSFNSGSILSLAIVVISGPLEVGLCIVFLEIIRNWQCEFADMFKGFKNFGTNFLGGLLVVIYTYLWSLLFIIPGIVKAYSYSMTFYILADNPELTANQAISESRRMMKGHKFRLFVLELSFFWWYILCGITAGLAYFYVAPYISATKAAFYEDLKNSESAVTVEE
ncbi:MAG: DUF975 family protein [Clostridia bacterium]|nr:DUF975 family protein [Clostridia bacterium]